MSDRWTRRDVLRGILGGAAVTVGLPALDCWVNPNGTAWATGEAFPTRFSMFYWGNGMLPDRWRPTGEGSGDDWALSEQLAALADHKDVLTVVTGLEVKVPNTSPHFSGVAGMLSGGELADPTDGSTVAGPTIDQVIAEAVGGATRFRSIEFGAEADLGRSYSGPRLRNPAESNPYLLWERIFGTGFRLPGEEGAIDPTWALRRSVLDAVMDDSNRLKQRVGAADKARLEQHLDAVRDLELRLARLEEDPPDYASCDRAAEPAQAWPDIDGRPQVREKNRVMCELIALAMACDQTRVASNFITEPVSNVLWAGATSGHHQLTHDEPGDQPQVNSIVKALMACYADMIEIFRNIPEGDATLLDHSVIFGTSEVSLGRTHSLLDMPMLYAGSAGGRLNTNLHVASPGGEGTSPMILSLLRAVGVSAASWGDGENRATNGLSAIEA